MIRRVFALIAAVIAAACLTAFTKPAQASSQSAVAATAAHHCSQLQAVTRHRSKSQRTPASAKIVKVKHMCAEVHTRVGTIRYWNKPLRSWTLYKHYRHLACWDLRRKHLLEGPEGLCAVARGAVRTSTQKLVHLDAKIKALLPKPVVENINLPYRHFSSCLGAVNYLFHGRWDLSRARMVVHRESTNNPNADNGSHFGCAQESTKMMSDHLRGPWDDAYYNVWVLLWEAEHNGWCNWDIVNYCAPGGEF